LPAVAKDVPNNAPKPVEVCPAPPNQTAVVPSKEINGALAGADATICSLALTYGYFIIGAVCGVIVVVGILKAQGK